MKTLKQKIIERIEIWKNSNLDKRCKIGKLDSLKWMLEELERCETWEDVK